MSPLTPALAPSLLLLILVCGAASGSLVPDKGQPQNTVVREGDDVTLHCTVQEVNATRSAQWSAQFVGAENVSVLCTNRAANCTDQRFALSDTLYDVTASEVTYAMAGRYECDVTGEGDPLTTSGDGSGEVDPVETYSAELDVIGQTTCEKPARKVSGTNDVTLSCQVTHMGNLKPTLAINLVQPAQLFRGRDAVLAASLLSQKGINVNLGSVMRPNPERIFATELERDTDAEDIAELESFIHTGREIDSLRRLLGQKTIGAISRLVEPERSTHRLGQKTIGAISRLVEPERSMRRNAAPVTKVTEEHIIAKGSLEPGEYIYECGATYPGVSSFKDTGCTFTVTVENASVSVTSSLVLSLTLATLGAALNRHLVG